ncbi:MULTISPECIES: alpha/beta hydrolase [Clostridium]|uniref:alpha/beta hydrolase n=1 Tax=Clostridium TaxID=1485 RepID=UPI0008271600|nr:MULTISPECIES: alpha/beta hydrolase [Clostridium]PJI09088.1 alpha/beta hydrolase [Clostridium sp. CT7]
MKKEDYSIYEYRMKKEIQNYEVVYNERLNGKFEKISVRTSISGYVDGYIYRPENYDGIEVLPVMFNFHGGGNVLGYPETDGIYCQRLADIAHCAVINVDYCLAPEFKFPKPILSTYEAIVKIKQNSKLYKIDANKIVVGGHSAGGYMAVVLCLLDRKEKKIGISGQIIDYAPLKQSLNEEDRKALDPKKAMSSKRILQYINWYFDDLNDLNDPLASPILADLHDLPKMLVLAAEYDVLSKDEQDFAKKAKAAGVDVTFEIFKNCQHGFTHKCLKEYNEKEADRAWRMMGQFLLDVFSRKQ